MRTDHRIEYVVVRGSCRYRLSEILRLLEDNTVRNEEGTIDTLFHNLSLIHILSRNCRPQYAASSDVLKASRTPMYAYVFDESLLAYAYETPPNAYALLFDRYTTRD